MNTGFLGPAVATVLTACGIETIEFLFEISFCFSVATVLTACGIETVHDRIWILNCLLSCNSTYRLRYWNDIIPPKPIFKILRLQQYLPLAVLKLVPLVDLLLYRKCCNSTYRLRYWNSTRLTSLNIFATLQQYLPLAVLKHTISDVTRTWTVLKVATVLTACGIET